MLGRRQEKRDATTDRRGLPRPSLRVNLLLLGVACAALLLAVRQRRVIDADYTKAFSKTDGGPAELNQIKAELAEMDLTRDALKKELDGRRAYIESIKSQEFYISIDTARNKMHLNFGNDVVRDANVQIGGPVTVDGSNGKTWTFVPLKGAFNVVGKEVGLAWRVPPWVYAMNKEPLPGEALVVANGLGKYVVLLPNDYVIHSPPAARSPLKGPKPGSFMVSEADLEAIWDRITPETRVYIF